MIVGIGVDLVRIPRIERLLEKWGNRFKERVFSADEIRYSESHLRCAQHFAGSFAVKEAMFKALGKGHIRFLDIEVRRDEDGKPSINLYGRAREEAERMGVIGIHTSISHDGQYSVAVVILEKE
jgi:holo-[acyl-carrier protein] synthase